MTLTEVNYYFRKLAPLAGLGFFLLIFLYFFIKLSLPIIFPPPVKSPPINPIFDKIAKIEFSQTLDYPENVSFVLDTIEGEPITATATAKVYQLISSSPRFGYLEKIYLMAKGLGFNTKLIKHRIENKKAVFEDGEKKLTVDITNFNFEYQYNYQTKGNLFQNTFLPSNQVIKEKIKEFLRRLGRYPEELAQGKENIIFLRYNPLTKEFKVVENKREANLVEVDFYRPDIDGFPMVAPKYFNSQNFVVAVFKENDYQLIKAQIKFFGKEEKKIGIYPLKTGNIAWQELKEKKAAVVSWGEKTNQILIKKMFLGYYDPDVYQPYLQPVYVFLGNQGFVAYVPAIKEDYIQ